MQRNPYRNEEINNFWAKTELGQLEFFNFDLFLISKILMYF